MKIQNREELNDWLFIRRDHTIIAVKGQPLPGMKYSDGDPVLNPINVAWVDTFTNERFDIIYEA